VVSACRARRPCRWSAARAARRPGDAPGTQFEEHLDAPHEVERVIHRWCRPCPAAVPRQGPQRPNGESTSSGEARVERVTGIEPASRAWKARPGSPLGRDPTPMAQVRSVCDRPLLTVRDRQLPLLRARGGHDRRGPSSLGSGSDGHKLNRRVRSVRDDHLPRWHGSGVPCRLHRSTRSGGDHHSLRMRSAACGIVTMSAR
jgi:hypothetical protein